MSITHTTGPVAALLVAAADLSCWLWLGSERSGISRPSDLTALLTAICAWVLQVALTWVLVLVALTAAEPYAGRELASYAACPARLRPILLAVCGVAAVGAFTGPVRAPRPAAPADVPVAQPAPRSRPGPSTVDPPSLASAAETHVPATRRPRGSVVVRPGDSLWAITQRRLPRGASDAQVTDGWHRLYARNRARIGDDPDLLLPGTLLTLTTLREDR